MHFYTYRTTNLINGKYYIGVHASKREIDPFYLGSGQNIKRAIKKYGVESFSLEILKRHLTIAEAFEHEKELLTEEVLNDPMCYNMNPGGKGGSGSNHIKDMTWHKSPKSEKTKRKISETLMGKSHITAEGRKRCSEASKGNSNALGKHWKLSSETRQRISQARMGIQFSDEHKKNISRGRSGVGTGERNAMASAENRAKVAASKIGRVLLVGPNGERRLSKPNSEQWSSLIQAGYNPARRYK